MFKLPYFIIIIIISVTGETAALSSLVEQEDLNTLHTNTLNANTLNANTQNANNLTNEQTNKQTDVLDGVQDLGISLPENNSVPGLSF